MKKTVLRNVLFIASLILLSFFVFKEANFFFRGNSISFETPAREKLAVSAGKLNDAFTKARLLSDSIANKLSLNSLDEKNMRKMMQDVIGQFPIEGLFFAVESPQKQGANFTLLLSKEFGFTDLPNFSKNNTHYNKLFKETIASGKSHWTSPFLDTILGARVVCCCIPFHLENGSKGMVTIVYRTADLYDRLLHLGLSLYGVPYIMDTASFFIAHPLDETRSLIEVANEFNDRALLRLVDDMQTGKLSPNKNYHHRNTVTKKFCNEALCHIKENDWYLGLSIYDGQALESIEYRNAMKESAIKLILYVVLWLIFFILFIYKTLFPERKGVRFYSFLLPCLLLLMIIGIIMAYNRFPGSASTESETTTGGAFEQIKIDSLKQKFLNDNGIRSKWESKRMVDFKSLDNFLLRFDQESRTMYKEPASIIPTGLFIHEIQFLSSYEVRVMGIVWQVFMEDESANTDEAGLKYPTNDYEMKGVSFPGAQVNEYVQTDSVPTTLNGRKAVLYRWNFDINLNQHFSYSLYPFGRNEIQLFLWALNLDDNTILVPDLMAYKQLYPDVCSGIGNHVEINDMSILNSYYAYNMESYLCNFGNAEMYGLNRFPELTFNVSVSRKFADTLICKIIPLLVVLMLLFTILFVRDENDGFNNVIGCSGLFFVLVLDHINLREQVSSEGIIYLEYCYFFIYLLMLLIVITSFKIEDNPRLSRILNWVGDVLKNYFWSIILGFMALATMFRFF